MAFKLQTNPTFQAKITVRVPTINGMEDQDFQATMRVLPDEDWSNEADVRDVLCRAILFVDGVVDDAGAPIASSPDLIRRMVGVPFVRTALVRGYFEALAGARTGN